MKKHLPFLFTAATSILLTTAHAQADRFAYAVTDVNQEGVNWSYLRKLDLQTGSFSDVLLNGTDVTAVAYDASTKKQMTEPLRDPRFGAVANAAFGTGVAAIAYDKKNNRLYYTPMFIDQLRYIDLKTMKVFFVNATEFSGMKVKAADQSNIITRMAIASDGNGYAMTNDGNHLIRFSTGKKMVVTDLGAVVDDAANQNLSVHNSSSSFGGDMIADEAGNLYVFTARNHVFKINIESKIATHVGTITGLPEGFTSNGAAVDDNNQVLITSAVDNSSLYTVNTKTWEASASKAGPWRVADLANSNLLAGSKPGTPSITTLEEVEDGRIQLYPNPVTNKQFALQFNLTQGNYTVQVLDIAGRQSTQATVNSKGAGQSQTIQLPASALRGVYLVKVIDKDKKTIFSKKVMVQ